MTWTKSWCCNNLSNKSKYLQLALHSHISHRQPLPSALSPAVTFQLHIFLVGNVPWTFWAFLPNISFCTATVAIVLTIFLLWFNVSTQNENNKWHVAWTDSFWWRESNVALRHLILEAARRDGDAIIVFFDLPRNCINWQFLSSLTWLHILLHIHCSSSLEDF